jgi:hypothetical protein
VVAEGGPSRSITKSTRTTVGGTKPANDLPIFKTISDAVIKSPGMSETDMETGQKTPTTEGNKRASLANQVWLSNRNLDPQTAANIAVNGKPLVNERTGETVIEYNGKRYPYKVGEAAPVGQASYSQSESVSESGDSEGYAKGGKVTKKGLC